MVESRVEQQLELNWSPNPLDELSTGFRNFKDVADLLESSLTALSRTCTYTSLTPFLYTYIHHGRLRSCRTGTAVQAKGTFHVVSHEGNPEKKG